MADYPRTFALTRIRGGDYVLLSNDRRCVWRISTYHEDGSASWIDVDGRKRVVTGLHWRLRQWMRLDRDRISDGSYEEILHEVFEEQRCDARPGWVDEDICLPTRSAAIQRALESDHRRRSVDAEWAAAEEELRG